MFFFFKEKAIGQVVETDSAFSFELETILKDILCLEYGLDYSNYVYSLTVDNYRYSLVNNNYQYYVTSTVTQSGIDDGCN